MPSGMAFRAAQEDRYERELVVNTSSARCQAETPDLLLSGTRVTGQRSVQKPRPRVRAARSSRPAQAPRVRAPSGSGWQLRRRGAGQHAQGALVVEGLDDTGRVVVLAPVRRKEKAGGAEPRTGLKPPEGAARGVLCD